MAIAIYFLALGRVSAGARENFLVNSQHCTKNELRAGSRAPSIILTIVSFYLLLLFLLRPCYIFLKQRGISTRPSTPRTGDKQRAGSTSNFGI